MILERIKIWTARTVLALVAFATLTLMLHASLSESAIMDELAHIPAGYGYVRHLDYRLNPEHPPLVKVLAAFPLLFRDLNFPTERPAWSDDVNGQWSMGTHFLYESGNDADFIIRVSRLGPILLTLILIFFVWRWARELLGPIWALLPTLMVALSPHLLAHGHYVTTDVAAALGVLVATYYFLKFLFEPSREHLFAAALAFGFAQLAKFSAVLLIPYFIFLAAVYTLLKLRNEWPELEFRGRIASCIRRVKHLCVSLFLIFAAGYVILVYPAYALFTWNYPQAKQTADTEFILNSFAGGPTPPGEICKPVRCLAEFNIWMTKSDLTRPAAQHLLGVLMVLQRAAGGNTNYFMGEVSASGWWYYFPLVYALKEPLPILLIVLLATLGGIWGMARALGARWGKIKIRFVNYLTLNFTEFAMLFFVLLYWAWSIRGNLNIGVRHLIPALPFMYLLAAGFWKRWVGEIKISLTALSALALKAMFLGILIVWFMGEVLFSAPYYLAYFNELGGGVRNGYRYVTDSNYDWGQDLIRLTQWLDTRNNDDDYDNDIDKIAVDYFGGGNPKYYLGDKVELWSSARGNPSTSSGQAPPIRWLAVSVNTLQGATQRLAPKQERKPEDEYRWLVELKPPKPGLGNVPEPDFRAGTSIFIYKL